MIVFTITVETSFLASHQLTLAGSGQETEHSHNWVVQVAVCAEKLNEDGLVIDFCDLKEKIQAVVTEFEGKKLEEMGCFSGVNASAEIVARYIFDRIEPQLDTGLQLGYVEVTEAAGCRAKYSN
jgi:6-pyruvoyltetrahydropterin/6-carboxytetrahydropterin synthase